MRGIAGKPYINLDPYINTNLDEIEEEVSNATEDMESYVWYFPHNLYYDSNMKLMKEFYVGIPQVSPWENGPKHNNKIYIGTEIILRSITDYRLKQFSQYARWSKKSGYFPKLCDFITKLPFLEYGRATLFLTKPNVPNLVHCDSLARQNKHHTQFIWIRKSNKKFFLVNEATNEKVYIDSKAALFNSFDYHGADAIPESSFSIRVDGIFKPEFEEAIGIKDLKEW